jgi:hypothetical protein
MQITATDVAPYNIANAISFLLIMFSNYISNIENKSEKKNYNANLPPI